MQSRVPNGDHKDHRPGGGISLQTLIVASLASAVASFAASRIWGSGTLVSAAATPVVVALVSEFLRRPMQTVAASAKKVPRAQTVRARPRRRVEPSAAIRRDADPVTIKYYGKAEIWRPRWRTALVTGLVAFAIVVAFYTVPDLLGGRSITGNGQPTTFFGGTANVKNTSATTTVTTSTPTTTATKTTPTTTTTTTAGTTSTSSTTTTGTASTSSTTTPTSSTHDTITPPTSTNPPAVHPTTTQTTPAP